MIPTELLGFFCAVFLVTSVIMRSRFLFGAAGFLLPASILFLAVPGDILLSSAPVASQLAASSLMLGALLFLASERIGWFRPDIRRKPRPRRP